MSARYGAQGKALRSRSAQLPTGNDRRVSRLLPQARAADPDRSRPVPGRDPARPHAAPAHAPPGSSDKDHSGHEFLTPARMALADRRDSTDFGAIPVDKPHHGG